MKIGLSILAILFLIKTFLFELYIIPSQSMFPSIISGDILVIQKFNNIYKAGDVIVFREPSGKYNYIKRIIGLPTDFIEFKSDLIMINDRPINVHKTTIDNSIVFLQKQHNFFKENHYVISKLNPNYHIKVKTNIPYSCYFVLGDNRDESEDSRVFGCINHSSIKGKAKVIVFNLNIPRYSEVKSFFMIYNRIGTILD